MAKGKGKGREREEDEGRERDLPGQIDSERGRNAYSSPDNAGLRIIEGQESARNKRTLADTHQQNLNNLAIMHQANIVNHSNFMNALVGVLLASVITSNDNGNNGAVTALAEQMAKMAGTTPPITVDGAKSK